ncbi:hypothetical protein AOLI_G00297880 [Acnodon oligacanthus]
MQVQFTNTATRGQHHLQNEPPIQTFHLSRGGVASARPGVAAIEFHTVYPSNGISSSLSCGLLDSLVLHPLPNDADLLFVIG